MSAVGLNRVGQMESRGLISERRRFEGVDVSLVVGGFFVRVLRTDLDAFVGIS
jgi:hypothetical protein